MTESQSTYAGRKIRIEGQDEMKKVSPAQNAKPELGYMTLVEAESKGLLKAGMAVVFKDYIFGPIALDEEMTGQKQQVTCELSKGVIAKNQNGKFVIFSVLRVTSDEGLVLKGRFGRANGYDAICQVAQSVCKKIKNCNAHFASLEEFVNFCSDNYLAVDYFQKAMEPTWVLFGDNNGLARIGSDDLTCYYINIQPGNSKNIYMSVAVTIEGEHLGCYIKKGTSKTITHLHTYFEHPYDKYVEIRGGL